MLQFTLHPDTVLAYAIEQRILVSDFEGDVWPCKTTFRLNELTIETEADSTCYLHLPWITSDGTEIMLSTATLLIRPRKYSMPLELARGTLNRLLNHVANWESAGYEFPQAINDTLEECKKAFVAALHQHPDDDSLNRAASQALEKIVDLELSAVPAVTSVLIDSRGNKPQVNTLLGGTLPREFASDADVGEDAFEAAFGTALMPLSWRTIQAADGSYDWSTTDRQLTWCQDRQMRTVAGPLMRLDPRTMPEWVLAMRDDSHGFLRKADQFVRAAAAQYGSKVNLWYAAAGMNMATTLGINEESRLRLTAACVESIREVDPQTPVMVGFDQPWGEYLGAGKPRFCPDRIRRYADSGRVGNRCTQSGIKL